MTSPMRFPLRPTVLASLIAACFGHAQANPVAPSVVNGVASFSQQGQLYTITNSPNTIIDWRSFSIAAGEITRFVQQNGDSRVLNRITGQDPSQILGALQSNGKVFLVNPNGIVFGAGARVDVNGLVASTLNISNADFLMGKNVFSGDGSAGKLINQGSITTPAGGQVYLLAPSVENSGVITAPNGDVILAAGRSVQLVDSADPNIQVVVSASGDQALNLGSIVAEGARVGVYGALVNQRGTINADSAVRGADGKIVLKASDTVMLEQNSSTSARGSQGQRGGEILVLGNKVGLTGNALIDASGDSGGGKLLMGGDYQGKNAAVMQADATFIGPGVVVKADALVNGNGGTIVAWSRKTTRAHGSFSARGGAQGGDGGVVETSGDFLDVAGARVNTSAARGKMGNWLLDPYDIEVNAGRDGTLDDVANFSSGSATGTTYIGADLISEASSNVQLQAKHDIMFNAPIYNSSLISLTAQAGNDIRLNSVVAMQGRVVLRANDDSFGTASGLGGVTIVNGGGVTVLSSYGNDITLSGNYLTINGQVDLGGGNLTASVNGPSGFITLGSNSQVLTDVNGVLSFKSDNFNLSGAQGSLGTAGGSGTSVIFTSYTNSRGISLGGAASGTTNLNSLASVATGTLFIGDSSTSSITTLGAVSLNSVGALQLESAGNITLAHALSGTSTYGFKVSGTGTISTSAGASISGASTISLVADRMALGGGSLAASTISVDTHGSSTAISLGAESANQLSLTASELNTLHSGVLAIGKGNGYTGAVTLGGNADLNGAGVATQQLNVGGGTINVAGDFRTAAQLVLESGTTLSGSGALGADALVARAASVALTGSNSVRTVSGAASQGNFDYRAANDVVLGNVSASNGIIVSAAGDVTQAAQTTVAAQTLSLNVSGTAHLANAGNDVATLSAANTGAVTFNVARALTVDAMSLSGTNPNGAITLTSSGGIAVTGALNAAGGNIVLNGTSISGSGAMSGNRLAANTTTNGSVSLTGSNRMASVGGSAAGASFSYNSSGDYSLEAISADTIALSGAGNISQAANAGVLTASQLNLTSSGSASLLGNNQVTALSATDVGGLRLNNGRSLDVGPVSLASNASGTLNISAPVLNVTGVINGRAGSVTLAGNTINVNTAGSAALFDLSADALALNADLSASIAARLRPFSSGYSMAVGSSGCGANCLALGNLWHLVTPTLALGSTAASHQVGAIVVNQLASDNAQAAGSLNALTQRVALLSQSGSITQTGTLNVRDLAASSDGSITLTQAGNQVQNLAVAQASTAGVHFTGSGTVAVARLQDGASGSPFFDIDGISSNGAVNMEVAGAVVSGSGSVASAGVRSATLALQTTGGVGTASQALQTSVGRIDAINTAGGNASAPVHIANTGNGTAFEVGEVRQVDAGGGNGGTVRVLSDGAMVVSGPVATSTGALSLQSTGPLTVNGTVQSDSGAVSVSAGSTYDPANRLSVASNAVIRSTSGTVIVSASAYTATGGTIAGSNGPVSVTLMTPTPPPSVTPSVSTPGLSGVSNVNAGSGAAPVIVFREICSTAPDSALCQALSPPTAGQPGKPAQTAGNEVIRLMPGQGLSGLTRAAADSLNAGAGRGEDGVVVQRGQE